jgi:hypothetical protein
MREKTIKTDGRKLLLDALINNNNNNNNDNNKSLTPWS